MCHRDSRINLCRTEVCSHGPAKREIDLAGEGMEHISQSASSHAQRGVQCPGQVGKGGDETLPRSGNHSHSGGAGLSRRGEPHRGEWPRAAVWPRAVRAEGPAQEVWVCPLPGCFSSNLT